MAKHIRPHFLASLQSGLADNVRVLMDEKFSEYRSLDVRAQKLADIAEVGRNTIYRIIKPDEYGDREGNYIYPRLDSVARIARALAVTVPQLLTADFGAGRVAGAESKKRTPRSVA